MTDSQIEYKTATLPEVENLVGGKRQEQGEERMERERDRKRWRREKTAASNFKQLLEILQGLPPGALCLNFRTTFTDTSTDIL